MEAGIKEFAEARQDLIGELQVHLAWFAENNLTPLPPFPTREGGKDNNSPLLVGEGLGERSLSTNETQKECAARFALFIPQLKTLQKHINEPDDNGYIIFDDSVLDKRYSEEIEIVRRQYSG
ncbi:MAG: hypothetical protein V7L04_31275, partial [Nostoc sp.]